MGATVAHAFSVVAASTSGNVDITTTDLGGLTPKAAIIQFNYSTATTDAKNSAPVEDLRGISVFDGTRSRCAVLWNRHGGNQVSSRRAQFDDRVVQLYTALSTTEGTATASFITNGIRLNYTATADYAHTVSVVFFAGASIQVRADDVSCPHGSGTGTVSHTSPAFEPDAVFFFGTTAGSFTQSPTGGNTMTLGWALNDTGVPQYCLSNYTQWGSGSSTWIGGGAVFEKCAVVNTQSNTMYRAFRVSAFDADGFDLAFEPGSQDNYDLNAGYLAIDFDGTAVDLDVLSFNGGPASVTASTGFESQFVMVAGSTYDSLIDASTIADGGFGGHQNDEGSGIQTVSLASNHGTVREDCWSCIFDNDSAITSLDTAVWYHDRLRFPDFSENDEKTMDADVSFGASGTTWSVASSSQTTTTRMWVFSVEKNAVTLDGNDITTGAASLSSGTLKQGHQMAGAELVAQAPDLAKRPPTIVGHDWSYISLSGTNITTPLTVTAGADAALLIISGIANPATFDTDLSLTYDGTSMTIFETATVDGQYESAMAYVVNPSTGSNTLGITNAGGDLILHVIMISLVDVDTTDLVHDSQGGTANLTGMIHQFDSLAIGAITGNFARPEVIETSEQNTVLLAYHDQGSQLAGVATAVGYEYDSATSAFSFLDLGSVVAESTIAALFNSDFQEPTISLKSILDGDDITTGAPTLTSGTMSQSHVLNATDITTGNPTVTAGAFGQDHILSGDLGGIATLPASLSEGVLAQPHTLDGNGITTGTPTVTVGTLAQPHTLNAVDITTGAPVLPTPDVAGSVALDGNDITTGTPTVTVGTFGQSHVLDGLKIEDTAPTVTGGPLFSTITGATAVAQVPEWTGTFPPIPAEYVSPNPKPTVWSWAFHWRPRHTLTGTRSLLYVNTNASLRWLISLMDNTAGSRKGAIRIIGPNFVGADYGYTDSFEDGFPDDSVPHTLILTVDEGATTAKAYIDGVNFWTKTDIDPGGTWRSTHYASTATTGQESGALYVGTALTQAQVTELHGNMINGPHGDGNAVLAQTHKFTSVFPATGAPTLTTGTLAQPHTLDGDDITTGTPDVPAIPLTQHQILGAGARVDAGAPTVTAGTFTQKNILEGAYIYTQAPTVQADAVFNQAQVLDAVDLATQAPVLDTPSWTYRVHLDGDDLATQAPVLPALDPHQTHVLFGQEISPEGVFVPVPDLVQSHVLNAVDITTGAPTVTGGTVAQDHTLDGDGITMGNPDVPVIPLGGSSILNGNDITTQSPVIPVPDLRESNALNVVDITTGNPTLTAGAVGQSHVLDAQGVTAGVPDVFQGSLVQSHQMTANGVLAGLVALSEGAIAQAHALSGADLVGGTPDLDGWAFVYRVRLDGDDLTALAHVLATPDLIQAHVLDGDDLVGGTPSLSVANLNTDQVLDGDGLATQAPVLSEGTVVQHHELDGNSLTTGQTDVPVIPLAQSHSLSGTGVNAQAPFIQPNVGGTLKQTHVVDGVDFDTGNPTVTAGDLAQPHALSGADLSTESPVLSTGTVTQRHVLDGNDITTLPTVVPIPAFGGQQVFQAFGVTAGTPELAQATLRQIHSLEPFQIVAGQPDLSEGTAGQSSIAFQTVELVGGTPDLSSGTLGQGHRLSGPELVTLAPVLSEGRFGLADLLVAERTLIVGAVDRTLIVEWQDRTLTPEPVDRTLVVREVDRDIVVGAVDRTMIVA